MRFKRKNFVGTEIYYCEEEYTVEKVLRPNKFDCYLLCSTKVEGQVHSDGKTIPTIMTLIDVNNDEFVIKTTKTERLHDKLNQCREAVKELEDDLGDIWMANFQED